MQTRGVDRATHALSEVVLVFLFLVVVMSTQLTLTLVDWLVT